MVNNIRFLGTGHKSTNQKLIDFLLPKLPSTYEWITTQHFSESIDLNEYDATTINQSILIYLTIFTSRNVWRSSVFSLLHMTIVCEITIDFWDCGSYVEVEELILCLVYYIWLPWGNVWKKYKKPLTRIIKWPVRYAV